MVSVKVKADEQFERALRRFKKKWEKAGILKDYKSKTFYLKPSEQRKLAKAKVPIWKKKKKMGIRDRGTNSKQYLRSSVRGLRSCLSLPKIGHALVFRA